MKNVKVYAMKTAPSYSRDIKYVAGREEGENMFMLEGDSSITKMSIILKMTIDSMQY